MSDACRLRVYRAHLQRGGQRAYCGPVWAIADRCGTVLAYTFEFPDWLILEGLADAN